MQVINWLTKMNYNFSTLNDKEFEQITKDLLNAKFDLNLQNFKSGPDGGVDLRFSTSENDNSIVVQAKHYLGSGFSKLKSKLLSEELSKIKKLSPDRYIVVTSLPLSAAQKDQLRLELAPFILTSNDVIGQEDLNGYLTKFKEIEKKYFKLWFSSVNIFDAVLNNAIEGRTKFLMEKVGRKIPLFVITKKLDDAIKVLQKEKLLLITGQPGVGKTTLAEIILFVRAKEGLKIYKVEDLREAEDVFSVNNDEKQLFYFDDFLGANYLEIIGSHKTETQLTGFVERVKTTPNKYLILTTRTVILNHAIDRHEKISHSRLASDQFEIKLTDYTKYEKAEILYNHLFFNGVREDLHDSILSGKFYKKIIEHPNYTPRIIEFITDKVRIEELTPQTYLQLILNSLDNPKDIWSYSFNKQIDYFDRCLLLTLFSFTNPPLEPTLLSAFEKRLEYEKSEHNQKITSSQFNDSVTVLLNGFITSEVRFREKPERRYDFINPSLKDFLIGYVSDSYSEKKSLILSVLYVEQLYRFHPKNSNYSLEKELQNIVIDKISESEIQMSKFRTKWITENNIHIALIEVLTIYVQENADNVLLAQFKQLKSSKSISNLESEILMNCLLNIGKNVNIYSTINFIRENFIEIFEILLDSMVDENYVFEIRPLFELYSIDYEHYIESESGFNNFVYLIERILEHLVEELESGERSNSITDWYKVYREIDEINSLGSRLLDFLFPDTSFSRDFLRVEANEDFWAEKIEENLSALEDEEEDSERYYPINDPKIDVDAAIDDLFKKQS
ncbi:MAG: hypothetical protein EAY79_02690 [Runella slithyformis]|nr:MAG: hypothetical protein EAY79_02690 [Runella slithyformis]